MGDTSTSPLLLSGTSQRHSLLLHPLALTSFAPLFSSSALAPPPRAMSAVAGGHSSWLLGQGMAAAGHGEGLAAPFHAYTHQETVDQRGRPLHSPLLFVLILFVLFVSLEEEGRDLGLEYETTQGSRCEAKTHMNSVCGLWRDSWKIQGSRGKSVFLFLLFLQISG